MNHSTDFENLKFCLKLIFIRFCSSHTYPNSPEVSIAATDEAARLTPATPGAPSAAGGAVWPLAAPLWAARSTEPCDSRTQCTETTRAATPPTADRLTPATPAAHCAAGGAVWPLTAGVSAAKAGLVAPVETVSLTVEEEKDGNSPMLGDFVMRERRSGGVGEDTVLHFGSTDIHQRWGDMGRVTVTTRGRPGGRPRGSRGREGAHESPQS